MLTKPTRNQLWLLSTMVHNGCSLRRTYNEDRWRLMGWFRPRYVSIQTVRRMRASGWIRILPPTYSAYRGFVTRAGRRHVQMADDRRACG